MSEIAEDTLDWLKSINSINTCNCLVNNNYYKMEHHQKIQQLVIMIEQKDSIIYNLSKTLESLSNGDEILYDIK